VAFKDRVERKKPKAKAEGFSESERPYRAVWLAQASYVKGLNSSNWLRRVKAIEDLAFEWAGTTSTRDDIGDMAVALMKLAGKVRRTKNARDAFALGELWGQFQFATSPEKQVVEVRKAKGKKFGELSKKEKGADKEARNDRMKKYAKISLAKGTPKKNVVNYIFKNQAVKEFAGDRPFYPLSWKTIRTEILDKAANELKTAQQPK
jgi:hypothetical protein